MPPKPAYLRQKRKRLIAQLKKIDTRMLRGSLIERYKRCGKSNCHCVYSKGHGPTYYLSVSLPGRTPRLIYVPIELKQPIETAIENYQRAQNIMEQISSINRELFAQRATF